MVRGKKKSVCGSYVPADNFLIVSVYGSYCSGCARRLLNSTVLPSQSGVGEKFRGVSVCLMREKKISPKNI